MCTDECFCGPLFKPIGLKCAYFQNLKLQFLICKKEKAIFAPKFHCQVEFIILAVRPATVMRLHCDLDASVLDLFNVLLYIDRTPCATATTLEH